MRFILIATFTLLLTGCSLFSPYKMDVPQGNLVTQDMLNEVEIGMSKEQVEFVLGTPITSTPTDPDLWLYFYQTSENGQIVETQSIKLNFQNGALESIKGTALITDITH